MKKLSLISLLLMAAMCVSAAKVKPLKITFSAHDSSVNPVEIQFCETDTVIGMTAIGDTTGVSKTTEGNVVLNLTEPTYGIITYRFRRTTVYLEPGKDFNMEWDMTPAALTVKVTSKKSQINPYLASGEQKGPVMGDFGKEPGEIMGILEEYEQKCNSVLDKWKLDKTFVAKERKRLQLWVYGFLAQYAQQKPCGEDVYEKLSELAAWDEPWMMQTSEYTNYMYSANTALALRGEDVSSDQASQLAAVTKVLEHAQAKLPSPQLREYIIGTNAVQYIANNGTEGAERIKQLFEANVKDPEIVFAFNKAWEGGVKLIKGRPAPDFSFPDIDGNEVTLSSLRGKYVYIDIWATWCVPCRGEIPALKKLEETFQGMNIAFVSLSCDRDREKWAKTVRDDEMGGIQLWGNEDNDFLRKFQVQGIPRFIFIGPDGRIINPDMTRPTDPTTIEALGMVAMPMDE